MSEFTSKSEALRMMADARKYIISQKKETLRVIGFNIVRLRKEHNMTQGDLAAALGCSRGSIANIEGGRQDIGLPKFEMLCRILQTTPNDLMEFEK